jgi:serine/threonine protein kinase
MATVYKAHHERLERDVAIKVMHQAFQQDPNFHTRFAREAKIIARLEHPNIISVYDYAEFEGQPYLVMKYVEGRTLKHTLIKQKLMPDDILRVMTPLAGALDYAHRMGILHRDIKPSNIIIDANGTPYLTDFGMARIAQTGESTISADMMLGTPQYIAPEQALGSQNLDARTDLYSFGVVLYEMVVGQVPFSGDTPYAVIHDHIYRALPAPSSLNPDVSPQVEAVLIKALAKQPDERYGSAAELMGELRAAFAGQSVGTPFMASDPKPNTLADAPLRVPTAPPVDVGTRHVSSAADPIATGIPSPAPRRKVEFSIDLGSEDINQELRKAGDELKKAGKEIGAALREVGDEIRREFTEEDKSRRKAKNDEARRSWQGWGGWQPSEQQRARWQGQSENWTSWTQEAEEDDNPKEMPTDEESFLRRRIKKRHDARNGFIAHSVTYFGVNALLWLIFLFVQRGIDGFGSPGGEFPWPMLVSLFWGAGYLAHIAETYFTTGERAAKRDRDTLHAMRARFGPEWYNIASKKQYKDTRRRVTAVSRELQGFLEHLGAYVGVNGGLWAIYLFSGGDFPWPIFVSFFWGLGLVGSAISAISGYANQDKVEGEIARELERELSYDDEKPKRKNDGIRLTDDGELTDSMIEEIEAEQRGGRRAR